MSKSRQKLDTRQQTFDFSWETHVDRYVEAKVALEEAIQAPAPNIPVENEFEACIEVAAAVKQAIRDWGRTREELVERINRYFGRTPEGAETDPPACRKPLSIHMLAGKVAFENFVATELTDEQRATLGAITKDFELTGEIDLAGMEVASGL